MTAGGPLASPGPAPLPPGGPLRIVAAPDSFKGSMTAQQAADAIERGIRRVLPDAAVIKKPMADGGEGTVRSLVDATGGHLVHVTVTGPLGRPVPAFFGLLGGGEAAVLEMAAASGLTLVPPELRNPLVTTTYGTGELIRAALDRGCRRLIIGIGGSATNDGGAGMAAALGVRLLDAGGQPVPPGGGGLAQLESIDASGLDPRLAHCEILVACDVDNPLTGPTGASAVFGPQKGATPEMVRVLEEGLSRWAALLRRDLGRDVQSKPGAGAAGGLGAGLVAFLDAQLRPGAQIVAEAIGLDEACRGAHLVITGEGRMDGQTVRGKTPMGVARIAAQSGVPVIALVGSVGPGVEAVHAAGIHAVLPIVPGPISLAEAMARGEENMEAACERAIRLLVLGWGTA